MNQMENLYAQNAIIIMELPQQMVNTMIEIAKTGFIKKKIIKEYSKKNGLVLLFML